MDTLEFCPRDHPTTPLVFTFAFNGYEYWCPGCGYKTGLFGHTQTMSSKPSFVKMATELKNKAADYLHYQASLSGAKVEDENGELIPLVVDEPVEWDYPYREA